jgi:hypothetical protein
MLENVVLPGLTTRRPKSRSSKRILLGCRIRYLFSGPEILTAIVADLQKWPVLHNLNLSEHIGGAQHRQHKQLPHHSQTISSGKY